MDEVDYKWLWDDIIGLKQKIRFKDRIEYRVSGKLHNTVGPAIVGFGDDKKKTTGVAKYYIKGEEIPFEEWSILVRPNKLKKIKKRIEREKGND